MKRAVFVGGGSMMVQFGDLMSWDVIKYRGGR
jgi:hypothetical protein